MIVLVYEKILLCLAASNEALVYPRTMTESTSMIDVMWRFRPSDLWEDAYTKFEKCVKSKNFSKDFVYTKIASQFRGIFMIIINYYEIFLPDCDSSPEALDLTLNSVGQLE